MAPIDETKYDQLKPYVVWVPDLMARLDWFEDILANAYHQYYCMDRFDTADEYVYEIRAIRNFRADLVLAYAPNSDLYEEVNELTLMTDFTRHDDGHWHPY